MPVNPFAISEDQCSVADTLRRLLEDSNDFASRRARLDAVEPDRMALWPAFAEQGVIAAAFDEGLGGFAGDARTIAVIMAEMGPALVVEPYLATAVVAGHAIGHWTDRNAARAASEAIIEGRRVYLLAHDCFETVHGPYVTARRSADTNTLTGTIPAVRHGELAHAFLVPARTDDGSVEFYWVEREHPGLHVQPYRLIDAAGGANLRFEDVRCPIRPRCASTSPPKPCGTMQWSGAASASPQKSPEYWAPSTRPRFPI